MSCCTNTYNLGCYNSCSLLSFGTSDFNGTISGVFMFPSSSVAVIQTISVIDGLPFVFDLSLVNENADFILQLFNSNGERVSVTIDEVVYDCFKLSTVLYGGVNVVGEVLPDVPNTPVVITADGGDTYTSATLIGRTVQLVFTDNVVRIPSEWSFNIITGTIVFASPRDAGEIIQITWV